MPIGGLFDPAHIDKPLDVEDARALYRALSTCHILFEHLSDTDIMRDIRSYITDYKEEIGEDFSKCGIERTDDEEGDSFSDDLISHVLYGPHSRVVKQLAHNYELRRAEENKELNDVPVDESPPAKKQKKVSFADSADILA